MIGFVAMSTVQITPRLACQQCKQRKLRCDKGAPCTACRNADLTCQSVQRARLPRGKSGRTRIQKPTLEDRVTKLESLLEQHNEVHSPIPQSENLPNDFMVEHCVKLWSYRFHAREPEFWPYPKLSYSSRILVCAVRKCLRSTRDPRRVRRRERRWSSNSHQHFRTSRSNISYEHDAAISSS